MIVSKIICNKCKKELTQDGDIYHIGITRNDCENITSTLKDMDLCVDCKNDICTRIKDYVDGRKAAVINKEFDDAINDMIEKNKKSQESKYQAASALFLQGYSVLAIQKKVQLPYKKIDEYLTSHGFKNIKHQKNPKKKNTYTEEQPAEEIQPEEPAVNKQVEEVKVAAELTVENVKALYYAKNMNMHETAAELGINIRELRDFCIKNNISKDNREYLRYMEMKDLTEVLS